MAVRQCSPSTEGSSSTPPESSVGTSDRDASGCPAYHPWLCSMLGEGRREPAGGGEGESVGAGVVHVLCWEAPGSSRERADIPGRGRRGSQLGRTASGGRVSISRTGLCFPVRPQVNTGSPLDGPNLPNLSSEHLLAEEVSGILWRVHKPCV